VRSALWGALKMQDWKMQEQDRTDRFSEKKLKTIYLKLIKNVSNNKWG